jgi:hypothetical protein
MKHQPDDDLDGCDIDFTESVTTDDEVAALLEEDEDALRSGDRTEAS